jgi:Fanconi anemia group M protein
MEKPTIKVDKRELRSGITDYLKNFGCKIQEENLEIADYVISDRTAIERKTFGDFISSLKDLRLFKQMKELTKFEKPILLIEGFDCMGNWNENSFFGALSSVILDFNISIIWTKDKRDSANFICMAAKREQFKEKRNLSIRVRKKLVSLEEEQKFLISGLPYVNSVLAERLLEKFGTPKKIFNAKKEELMEINKLGERKAERILEVLKTKSIER